MCPPGSHLHAGSGNATAAWRIAGGNQIGFGHPPDSDSNTWARGEQELLSDLWTVVLDHAFHMVDELHLRRDVRISECGRSMPRRLWVLLIIGAALTISLTWFYGIDGERLHLMIVVVVSSIVALSLMLAISFQQPLVQIASQGDDLIQVYWQQTGD